jgi:O-antigen ligase
MPRRMRLGGPDALAAAQHQPPLQAYPSEARPSRLLRWALYGFVFSLPFDAPGRLPLELTTLTGAGFLAVTLLSPRICYGRRPAALWWFLGYVYAYWLAYVLGGARFTSDALRSSLFYMQGLMIFCACFNLMRYEGVARRVLLTLVIAAAILAVMTVLGLGRIVDSDTERATVFGQNANRAARVLCAGLLAAIGLVFGRARTALRPSWMAWPIAALIGLAMIMGGSRGGLLALAVGLWTFSLIGKTFGIRLRNNLVALVTIALAAWGALQSPLMQRRIQLAAQGNLAGRQEIFPAALQLFKNRPLMGWGPSNQYMLAVRLGLPPQLHQTRDTHNLFLEVLTSTGLAGAIPFLTGLGLVCWGAWKARRGTEGILPAAQMAALLAGNLSGNYIVLKLQWLLLAYAMASWAFLTPHPRAPTTSPRISARRQRWG